jgi:hypothetical protein
MKILENDILEIFRHLVVADSFIESGMEWARYLRMWPVQGGFKGRIWDVHRANKIIRRQIDWEFGIVLRWWERPEELYGGI